MCDVAYSQIHTYTQHTHVWLKSHVSILTLALENVKLGKRRKLVMRKKEKNERENMSKGWGDRSVLEGGGWKKGFLAIVWQLVKQLLSLFHWVWFGSWSWFVGPSFKESSTQGWTILRSVDFHSSVSMFPSLDLILNHKGWAENETNLRLWINRTTWLNCTFIRSCKITFLINKVSFWKFG